MGNVKIGTATKANVAATVEHLLEGYDVDKKYGEQAAEIQEQMLNRYDDLSNDFKKQGYNIPAGAYDPQNEWDHNDVVAHVNNIVQAGWKAIESDEKKEENNDQKTGREAERDLRMTIAKANSVSVDNFAKDKKKLLEIELPRQAFKISRKTIRPINPTSVGKIPQAAAEAWPGNPNALMLQVLGKVGHSTNPEDLFPIEGGGIYMSLNKNLFTSDDTPQATKDALKDFRAVMDEGGKIAAEGTDELYVRANVTLRIEGVTYYKAEDGRMHPHTSTGFTFGIPTVIDPQEWRDAQKRSKQAAADLSARRQQAYVDERNEVREMKQRLRSKEAFAAIMDGEGTENLERIIDMGSADQSAKDIFDAAGAALSFKEKVKGNPQKTEVQVVE